ncbi:MAG: Grx4 family monothiol glutaredoxin [Pseudomonadota bacterium]
MSQISEDKMKEVKNYIEDNDVVLFIKGTARIPHCGFSAVVVQIFDRLGVKYKDVDILENKLWKELEVLSDWPTFPQVYVDRKFIGGCDITREMYQTGELQELLKQSNIEFNA